MTPAKALDKAVALMGGQSALARALKLKPQAVQQWVAAGRCPAKRAAQIESATWGKVRREQLRPDIFQEHPAQASA